jgi:hypothetical protein
MADELFPAHVYAVFTEGRTCVTPVGFEPTPLRTGALSQRLRPLGQSVLVCEVGQTSRLPPSPWLMALRTFLPNRPVLNLTAKSVAPCARYEQGHMV